MKSPKKFDWYDWAGIALGIAAVLFLVLYVTNAHAQTTSCGYPPFPPFGMEYVCVCDAHGQNCTWILVSKRR